MFVCRVFVADHKEDAREHNYIRDITLDCVVELRQKMIDEDDMEIVPTGHDSAIGNGQKSSQPTTGMSLSRFDSDSDDGNDPLEPPNMSESSVKTSIVVAKKISKKQTTSDTDNVLKKQQKTKPKRKQKPNDEKELTSKSDNIVTLNVKKSTSKKRTMTDSETTSDSSSDSSDECNVPSPKEKCNSNKERTPSASTSSSDSSDEEQQTSPSEKKTKALPKTPLSVRKPFPGTKALSASVNGNGNGNGVLKNSETGSSEGDSSSDDSSSSSVSSNSRRASTEDASKPSVTTPAIKSVKHVNNSRDGSSSSSESESEFLSSSVKRYKVNGTSNAEVASAHLLQTEQESRKDSKMMDSAEGRRSSQPQQTKQKSSKDIKQKSSKVVKQNEQAKLPSEINNTKKKKSYLTSMEKHTMSNDKRLAAMAEREAMMSAQKKAIQESLKSLVSVYIHIWITSTEYICMC